MKTVERLDLSTLSEEHIRKAARISIIKNVTVIISSGYLLSGRYFSMTPQKAKEVFSIERTRKYIAEIKKSRRLHRESLRKSTKEWLRKVERCNNELKEERKMAQKLGLKI